MHDHGNSIIQFDYRKCTVFNFQHFRGVFAVSYAMFIMLILAFAWSATRLRKFGQDFPLYHSLHTADPFPLVTVDVLIIIIIVIIIIIIIIIIPIRF